MASASRTRCTASEVKDNCLKDSDTSEIVIEVLCKHFCRRLPFVYDVDRGFQVSGRHCQCQRRQDRRDVVDWISQVPTQIWSTFILNMCLILRPMCREFNSL